MEGLRKTTTTASWTLFWPSGQAHPEYKSGVTSTSECLVHVPIKVPSTENKTKMFFFSISVQVSDPRSQQLRILTLVYRKVTLGHSSYKS
jgi:hypothetical protein